jgi:hypothetical protein
MKTGSGLRRKLALLLMLATASGCGFLWSPPQEPSSQRRAPLPAVPQLTAQAIADFDGDHLPDRAELVSNDLQKGIRLMLSSRQASSLRFSSETEQPGSIYAEDIDHDSDEDLVWVSDQQPTHTAIWLNNGIGGLARVSNPAAYATEIKCLIASGSRNGSLASFVSEGLKATATSGFNLLAMPNDRILETPHSTSPKRPRLFCEAAVSPCVSRHPKRGPPSFLS